MENKIIPTVGRVVYYKPTEKDPFHNSAEILPAIITAVFSDEMINVKVINDGDQDFWKTSIKIGQEKGQWDWMPFQKQSASNSQSTEPRPNILTPGNGANA